MGFISPSKVTLDDFFLYININDSTLYDNLSKNKSITLLTDRSNFVEDGLIEAKYNPKNTIYSFADSIYLKIWSTLTFLSPDSQGKYSDIQSGRQIKLFVYHSQKSTLDSNYNILNQKITIAIKTKYPNWTNHKGAREGVYFLTDKSTPILSIYKGLRQRSHLVVEVDNLDR